MHLLKGNLKGTEPSPTLIGKRNWFEVAVANFPTKSRTSNIHHGKHDMVPHPVLLVEDSRAVANMLKASIEQKWQCEVHHASSYDQAKALLREHRRDYFLVICDLNLPDAPNGEVLELVALAKLKSIVITGKFGEEFKKQMPQKNIVDYMLKDSHNAFEYVVEQVGRLYHNQFVHLLVVEDSALSRSWLKHLLELRNFRVTLVKDGVEALAYLKEHNDIRLVITDYNMPDMNGVELTVEIRKKQKKQELAIIGISAQDESDLGVQFIKNGANDFVTKPVSDDELICRINQNLDTQDHIRLINNLANRDYLTNLFNRRCFFNRGAQMLEKAIGKKQSVAVAMLDLDCFKKLNDEFGHDAGDEVLISFAGLLLCYFPECLVARLGGEEFVALAIDMSPGQFMDKLERFRAALAGVVIQYEEIALKTTASIGVTTRREERLELMMKAADQNLYLAKQNGRNQIKG